MTRPRLPYRLPGTSADRGAVLFGLVLLFFVLSVAATQLWAARFDHHPDLGEPVADAPLLGPVYSPFRWMAWRGQLVTASRTADHAAQLRSELDRLLLKLGAVGGGGGLLLLASFGRGRRRGDVHGSARPATSREIAQLGLRAGKTQVVIGGEKRLGRYQYFYAPDARHVGIFGPSGCGKTSKLIIPTLLRERRCMIVLDIKMELHHWTAEHRRTRLGHTVHAFAPSIDEEWVSGYNPLMDIERGPGEVAAAQALAQALVDPEGKMGTPDFWHASAQTLITAAILHVLYTGDRSLGGVHDLLAAPDAGISKRLRQMHETEHDPALRRGWVHPETGNETPTHPAVTLETAKLLDLAHETLTGIVATARSRLALFLDPVVAKNTRKHDFSLRDLGNPDKPTTLYLVLPARDIARLGGLLRLFLQGLSYHLTGGLGLGTAEGGRGLVLCLDELAAVGKLDLIARQIAFLRGYGIQVIAAVQTANQLYELYGDRESVRGNLAYLLVFPSTESKTAEEISRLLGDRTVYVESTSRGSTGRFLGKRHTETLRDQKRPLLTPDEVRRLGDDRPVLLVAGAQPVFCRMVGWWHIPTSRAPSSPGGAP